MVVTGQGLIWSGFTREKCQVRSTTQTLQEPVQTEEEQIAQVSAEEPQQTAQVISTLENFELEPIEQLEQLHRPNQLAEVFSQLMAGSEESFAQISAQTALTAPEVDDEINSLATLVQTAAGYASEFDASLY